MKNGLHTAARKYTWGWVGFVQNWYNEEKIWSKSCEILRGTKTDALQDAAIEAVAILEFNGEEVK